MRKIVLFLLLLCTYATSKGQQSTWNVETGMTVSRAGSMWQSGINYSLKSIQLTAGYQQSIKQNLQPEKTLHGGYVTGKILFIEHDKVNSFIGIHNQTIWFTDLVNESNLYQVMEISIIQGVSLAIGEHLLIGEWFGIGRYVEFITVPSLRQNPILDWADFSGKVYVAVVL